MTSTRRRTGRRSALAALALGTLALPRIAGAQAGYPDRPLRVLVGFPAGSTGDMLMRIIAPRLGELLGQPIVVDNRPGAGSSIAADAVAHSRPDGYTLLLSTTANVINPSLFRNLGFDFASDLVPVLALSEAPALVVTHAASAVKDIATLIAAAKAKPDGITFASSGNGTFTHLYGELFNQSTGVRLMHVPYRGSSPAITDLLAGRVDLQFTPASTVVPQVLAGRLRALGVIGRRRMVALPDVPTLTEARVPGFEAALWFGLNAPRGTPPAVVQRLAAAFSEVLLQPAVREQLAAQSIEPLSSDPAGFAALIASEQEKWARVIQAADIKPE